MTKKSQMDFGVLLNTMQTNKQTHKSHGFIINYTGQN